MATKTQGLTIRTKLMGMVLLLVFFSIAVGIGSFYGLSQTVKKYQPFLLEPLQATHNIDAALAKARQHEKIKFVDCSAIFDSGLRDDGIHSLFHFLLLCSWTIELAGNHRKQNAS